MIALTGAVFAERAVGICLLGALTAGFTVVLILFGFVELIVRIANHRRMLPRRKVKLMLPVAHRS